jgi:hypothetical protein
MFEVWKRRINMWLFSNYRKPLAELHNNRRNIESELHTVASSKYGGIECEV